MRQESEERQEIKVTLQLTEWEMEAITLVEDWENVATFACAMHYLLAQGLRLYVARHGVQGEPRFVPPERAHCALTPSHGLLIIGG